MTGTDTTNAMAEATGAERAANELRRQLGIERGKIATTVEGLGTQEPPRPGVRDIDFPHRQGLFSMASQLGRHAQKVRALQAELSALDVSETVQSPRQQAREIFDALVSSPRLSDVRSYLSWWFEAYTSQSTKRLGELERTIGWLGETSQFEGGFEDARARLEDCCSQRRKHRVRLETIGYDPEDRRRNAAAAIAGAGRVDHIAACVRVSWQASGKWLEADPCYSTLQAHREALAACEAKLAKASDAKSRRGVAPRRKRVAAAEQVEATIQFLTDRRQVAARSLVTRAAAADEDAVQELVSLAAGSPGVYPEGFAKAFEIQGPSDEQLVGTLEVLLTGE
jgi:hypothetical protein